jgi:hypothetical protein
MHIIASTCETKKCQICGQQCSYVSHYGRGSRCPSSHLHAPSSACNLLQCPFPCTLLSPALDGYDCIELRLSFVPISYCGCSLLRTVWFLSRVVPVTGCSAGTSTALLRIPARQLLAIQNIGLFIPSEFDPIQGAKLTLKGRVGLWSQ